MRPIQRAFFLLFAALLTLPLSAQRNYTGDQHCGYTGKSQWLTEYQQGLHPGPSKSMEIKYMPLRVHILADDDGTNFANPLLVASALQLLNSDFLDQNIQFFLDGDFNYINNTRWNVHDRTGGDEMMRRNNVANRVNTYIVEDPNSNCGYYSPPRDAVVLGRNCLSGIDRTWSHEMGHYFSLPHTFFGWEALETISAINLDEPAPPTINFFGRTIETELVDGSNCTTAADGFCDTAPDFLMQRWACNREGFYVDSLLDADSTRFAVAGFNIMSYATDVCVERFTDDQKDAMQANVESILTDRPVSSTTPNLEAASPTDVVLISPEDGERLPFRNQTNLVWNKVPNALYYIVQVHENSNLEAAVLLMTTTADTSLLITEGLRRRTNYWWRVRPVAEYNVGGAFGATQTFRNGSDLVSTIDASLNAAITVAPNPLSGGQLLRIEGRDLGVNGALNYQLIDAAGRVVFNREGIPVNSSGISERIETGHLAAGIYFLRMRVADRMISRRIVVTP